MNHWIKYEKWTFPADKIRSGNLYRSMSLLSTSLEADSLFAEVECSDPTILDFERNTPLYYYNKPEQPVIFRVQSILRTGPSLYEITATSTLGLLIEGQHMGGIYTGQTAENVIKDICGAVPVIVKTALCDIRLYGWLPIASPRDNLSQVLFAIGAALKTDLDGVLRVEGLWNGFSGGVSKDNMYTDATVDYDGKVTQVIVSEHQYVPWTEEKQLFEGTAQEGDIITFDDPMHTLTASGFTILASGANWAKVSAGTGVLSGRTYLHNTRQVSRLVSNAREPNIKTVEDATLVSLVNSQACAQRLADYYKCRERVDASVVYHSENPGDRLVTYHPFDKTCIAACLESADITLSNTLKAEEKSLVGFVPKNPVEANYYDTMVTIRNNLTWVVPEGVTSIRVVLIGGGRGGWSGNKGSAPESGSVQTGTNQFSDMTQHYKALVPVLGGKGGDPGQGGEGGKIYSFSLDVTPGQSFVIKIGAGGAGGAPGEESVQGSEGGATTFGSYSSASGASSPSGFLEETSGKIFAGTGAVGIAGGNGSGEEYNGSTSQGITYGTPVTTDGNTWYPGASYGDERIYETSGDYTKNWGAFNAIAYGGYGGGAAYGSSGKPGYSAETGSAIARSSPNFVTYNYATSVSARGGDGADALPPPKQTGLGSGGIGGNGGGGAGSFGLALSQNNKGAGTASGGELSAGTRALATGGSGSAGGAGGDGGVLIYYAKAVKISFGRFVDKNGRNILDRLFRRLIV